MNSTVCLNSELKSKLPHRFQAILEDISPRFETERRNGGSIKMIKRLLRQHPIC